MRSTSALSIRGLNKSFGKQRVLVGLDLDVPDGSLTAVLGRSGCGKTTLLRLVAGFEYSDSGTIRVGDTLVVSAEGGHLPPERRGVGVVSQEGALFPHLDVAENIAFGLPRAQRRAGRVQELLSLIGLARLERRFPLANPSMQSWRGSWATPCSCPAFSPTATSSVPLAGCRLTTGQPAADKRR